MGYHAHLHPDAGWIVVTGSARAPDPEWNELRKVVRRAARELRGFGFMVEPVGHAELIVRDESED